MDRRVCWLDYICDYIVDALGVSWNPVIAAVVGVLCYAAAITPLVISEQEHLVADFPIVLGAVGIAWVCFSCRQVTLNYVENLLRLEGAVRGDCRRQFQLLVFSTLRAMRAVAYDLVPTLLIWISGVFLTLTVWYGHIQHPAFRFLKYMPDSWYKPELLDWRLASVAVMALPVVGLTFTTGRLLVLHTLLIHDLQRIDFVSSPQICLRRFKPLLGLGVIAAVTWSVGVGMFGVLLISRLTPVAVVGLACLGAIGGAGLALPARLLHRKLVEVRDMRVAQLIATVINELEGESGRTADLNYVHEMEQHICEHYICTEELLEWRYVLTAIGTVILPIVITAVQIGIE